MKKCTTLVEHTIETGTNSPITSHLSRLASCKKTEVYLQAQEMLSVDIVETSAIPWSSAVVLVEKKMYHGDFLSITAYLIL